MIVKTASAVSGSHPMLVFRNNCWCVCSDECDFEVTSPSDLSELGLDHYNLVPVSDTEFEVVLFSDLHRHSENSLLDGMTKIPQMVEATEYSGALTDHGNMYGFLEYYKAMKEAGKKPIIGMEAYMEDNEGNLSNNHLLLLAKNNAGYQNLLKLASESFDHFYKHPHITWEMLEKYHEGVIAASACLGGLIPQYVLSGDEDNAIKTVERFISIFGKDDFYIEIQRHGLDNEDLVEAFLVAIAQKYDLKVIATTDSHYPKKEDARAHEVMLCMQRKALINEPHWKFEGTGYHLHSSDEMAAVFSDHREWLDNTLELAEKCDVTLTLGKVNLPDFDVPKEFAGPFEYFKHLCKEGFKTRFNGTAHLTEKEYLERFDYEMSVIEQMGFAGYFLIVQDYANWARAHDIYVGPGRGSAAGSLLAYCLGITDLDPIKYNLLFERFLNPERVSMPDIDMDFEHDKRELVLNYVAQKYGIENVCHIVTFGTLGAKTALRDVCRTLGYPYELGARLSKMVPDGPKVSLQSAIDSNPDFRNAVANEPDVKTIVNIALRLEGCKRHSSQHACFDGDTLITTSTGLKHIRTIQVGEEVLTHEGRYKPVVDVQVNQRSEIHRLRCDNGSILLVTPNHPLLLATPKKSHSFSANYDLSWVTVRAIEVGDAICSMSEVGGLGITHVVAHELMPNEGCKPMYNLTVLDDSSYVANNIVAHNCGYIVAPSKVDKWLPTSMEKDQNGEKALTAQVTMSEAEDLGLLKMDFLGLKNMTVIHDVINTIKKTRGIDIDYHDIPLGDRETYKMLAEGLTGGVFQLESNGMTKVVQQMLPDIADLPEDRLEECFERIIAAVALFRPGPMAYIPDYVRGIDDPSSVHYDCPEEENILKSTYGVMVYQEQLMHIAQTLAGYSMGEADILRKACGKKKKDVMAKERDRFIYGNKKDFDAGKVKHLVPGCVGNGIKEHIAQQIWEKMKKFAEYAFNRSHAACYAYVAMITAYMACHWAPEFYAAMMNAFIENSDKLRGYLGQASKRGIKILPPDINQSTAGFYAHDSKSIRFGLRGIKGVSAIANAIDAERSANGPFNGIQDFYQRMTDAGHQPSESCVKALIAAGAFAFVSENKRALFVQLETVIRQYSWLKKNVLQDQMDLFGGGPATIPLPVDVFTTPKESLEMEHQFTCLYITGHPADIIYPLLARDRHLKKVIDLPGCEGQKVSVVGIIEDLERRFTRKGDVMYRFNLSDQYGTVRCVMFPKRVTANQQRLVEGALVKAIARYDEDEDFGSQLIVDDLISEMEIVQKNKSTVCVTIFNKDQQVALVQYAKANPGSTKVNIKYKGKVYTPKLTINLGQKELEFLQSTFPSVVAA